MSYNLDFWNLTLGFFIGIVSGLIIEEIRFRHEKSLSTKQRLMPLVEKMLGIVASMRENGKNALDLKYRYEACLKFYNTKTERHALLKEVDEALLLYSFKSLLGLADKSKEFEKVYSELTEKGMLETLGIYDKNLYVKIKMTHNCTENFSKKKVDSIDDALKETIITYNLVRYSEDLEKSLRSFIF